MKAKQSIIERIQNSGGILKVKRRALINEMLRLYRQKDRDGMKTFYEAYQAWEIRGNDGARTLEEIVELAKQNIDTIARVADGYLVTENIESGAILAGTRRSFAGPVSQFYREVVDYHPHNPEMN